MAKAAKTQMQGIKPVTDEDERSAAIAKARKEIEGKYGAGAIMRFGDNDSALEIEAIPTGSLALDVALGIGGVPRGRIVEIYGPE
ncbi:MAG: DNA recombination/repair protein RecA, partial [Coriobacteriaceae bacterium]|nr:DNA recombination/repair protein RecA [Coriobacteriaceae bacterium]